VPSQVRLDVSKPLFLERLLKAWEKRPDLTLGQIISGAVLLTSPTDMVIAHLLRIGDRELAEAVERFVLMDEPSEPHG